MSIAVWSYVKAWLPSGALNGKGRMKKPETAVISPERLLVLNWPDPDPGVGVIDVGRRLTAWRNDKHGLTIVHNADAILQVSPAGRITIAMHPNVGKTTLYSVVRSACVILKLGDISLKVRKGRLTAVFNGMQYIANAKGVLVIKPLRT